MMNLDQLLESLQLNGFGFGIEIPSHELLNLQVSNPQLDDEALGRLILKHVFKWFDINKCDTSGIIRKISIKQDEEQNILTNAALVTRETSNSVIVELSPDHFTFTKRSTKDKTSEKDSTISRVLLSAQHAYWQINQPAIVAKCLDDNSQFSIFPYYTPSSKSTDKPALAMRSDGLTSVFRGSRALMNGNSLELLHINALEGRLPKLRDQLEKVGFVIGIRVSSESVFRQQVENPDLSEDKLLLKFAGDAYWWIKNHPTAIKELTIEHNVTATAPDHESTLPRARIVDSSLVFARFDPAHFKFTLRHEDLESGDFQQEDFIDVESLDDKSHFKIYSSYSTGETIGIVDESGLNSVFSGSYVLQRGYTIFISPSIAAIKASALELQKRQEARKKDNSQALT